MKKFLRRYYLAIIWSIVVLLLSIVKVDISGGISTLPYADKLVHALLYFILTLLLVYETPLHTAKTYVLLWTLIVSYGGLMEVLQFFIPYRSGDMADVVANMIGVTIAIIFTLIIQLWKGRNSFSK